MYFTVFLNKDDDDDDDDDALNLSAENRGKCTKSASILQPLLRGYAPRPPKVNWLFDSLYGNGRPLTASLAWPKP